ncbi:hypothetical protein AMTR_s00045p00203300 [Amborella trichopoda]|uniref:Uncharacterized protein n=1 Tax=Amborella trichopoda TaxID=13333 RepID=W1P2R8_AMBTC|nr:hypothetical protein AMTR_s00045p00203300 [Amborella trichopoda]
MKFTRKKRTTEKRKRGRREEKRGGGEVGGKKKKEGKNSKRSLGISQEEVASLAKESAIELNLRTRWKRRSPSQKATIAFHLSPLNRQRVESRWEYRDMMFA